MLDGSLLAGTVATVNPDFLITLPPIIIFFLCVSLRLVNDVLHFAFIINLINSAHKAH